MQPASNDNKAPTMKPPEADNIDKLRNTEALNFNVIPLPLNEFLSSTARLRARRRNRPDIGYAADNLFYAAWRAPQSGSLPDQEEALAEAAGVSDDVWALLKADAMADWTLRSDGRWYNPLLTLLVQQAWAAKIQHQGKSSKGGKAKAAKDKAARQKAATGAPEACSPSATGTHEACPPPFLSSPLDSNHLDSSSHGEDEFVRYREDVGDTHEQTREPEDWDELAAWGDYDRRQEAA